MSQLNEIIRQSFYTIMTGLCVFFFDPELERVFRSCFTCHINHGYITRAEHKNPELQSRLSLLSNIIEPSKSYYTALRQQELVILLRNSDLLG